MHIRTVPRDLIIVDNPNHEVDRHANLSSAVIFFLRNSFGAGGYA